MLKHHLDHLSMVKEIQTRVFMYEVQSGPFDSGKVEVVDVLHHPNKDLHKVAEDAVKKVYRTKVPNANIDVAVHLDDGSRGKVFLRKGGQFASGVLEQHVFHDIPAELSEAMDKLSSHASERLSADTLSDTASDATAR